MLKGSPCVTNEMDVAVILTCHFLQMNKILSIDTEAESEFKGPVDKSDLSGLEGGGGATLHGESRMALHRDT